MEVAVKTITTRAGARMTWDDGNVVHYVESAHDGGGITVFWTLCHHDVPDGTPLDRRLTVTCAACLEAVKNRH
jgi:hypothetical protein